MKKNSNLVFCFTVLIFLILVIIAKVSYERMKEEEGDRLATARWYSNDDRTVEKLGDLEIVFNDNDTFDIYKSDTQISCMTGTYNIIYKGLVHLKSEKSGFESPKGWKCKTSAYFTYKIKDNKLYLKHSGCEGVFNMQGANAVKKEEEEKITDLHNMNFVNEQAKMMVCFYAGDMYIYNLDDVTQIYGDNDEVLGNTCLFGPYTQDSKTNKITVKPENEGDVNENILWPEIKELGEYEFLYRIEGDFESIVLQYGEKSYEFKRSVKTEE